MPTEDDAGPAPRAGRIYLDHYIVLFSRNEVLKVMAMTTRDPHLIFSNRAEPVIKSFNFGSLRCDPSADPRSRRGPATTATALTPSDHANLPGKQSQRRPERRRDHSDLRKRHPDRRRSPHDGHDGFSRLLFFACLILVPSVAAQDARRRSRSRIKTCRF